MRHRLIACVTAVLFAALGAGRADPPKPADEHSDARKLAEEAMKGCRSGGFSGFLDVAFSGSGTSLRKTDRTKGESLAQVYDTLAGWSGKEQGPADLIYTDVAGRSAVRFVYLERRERGPMFWHLDFVRGAGDVWRWSGFNVTNLPGTDFRPAKADALNTEVAALAADAVAALKADSIAKLLDGAYGTKSVLVATARDGYEAVLTKYRTESRAAGDKPLGTVEFVRVETVGDALVRLVYLERWEAGASAWKFTFYRTATGWKWQNLESVPITSEFVPAK